jgi:hypothetical protein
MNASTATANKVSQGSQGVLSTNSNAAVAIRPKPTLLPPDLFLLCLVLLVNCAWSVLWPSQFTAIAATLLWLVIIARVFVADPRMVVMLLPFIIVHFSVQVSLNAIEAGAYMKEMGSTGQASTASTSYVIYSLIFLLSSGMVYRHRRLRPLNRHKTINSAKRPLLLAWVAVVIGAPIVGYLLLAGIRNGFPLLSGTDRFEYRTMSADTLTLNFLNLKFIIAALLGSGAMFAATTIQRICHHLTFLSYVLISFLFGDKFFIILVAASFYSMPFVIYNPDNVIKTILRFMPFAMSMIFCVFAVTMFIYSDYGSRGVEETLVKLGERVAGQGQLWFLAVRDSSHFIGLDLKIVRENLASLLASPSASYVFEHRLGPFYFVEKYMPTAIYLSVLNNSGSVTPTMVFEAYGLVTFGYAGLTVVLVTLGALVGIVLEWMARSMMSGNPINALLPAYITTGFYYLVCQATLYTVFSLSSLKAYAAFLILQLIVSEAISAKERFFGSDKKLSALNP